MPITLDEFRKRFPNRPEPVSLEYAGMWIAVKTDLHTILASGHDPIEVRREAVEAGHQDPILRYIPGATYIGRR